jgi:hypothetical protein
LLDFGNNIGKLKVVTNYPLEAPNTETEFNKYNKEGYTGIILKHEDYLILLPILTHQNAVEYTKIVYTCTINKEKREKKFGLFKSGKNYIRTIFPKCDHILKISAKKNEGKFGYIITENIENIEYEYKLLDNYYSIKYFNINSISDEDKTFARKEISRLTEIQTEIINNINKIYLNYIDDTMTIDEEEIRNRN